jgi:hypothetical protein
VVAFAQFLKTNIDAKKISLQSQNLDKKDLKLVAKFLKGSETLEELDLSYNNVRTRICCWSN